MGAKALNTFALKLLKVCEVSQSARLCLSTVTLLDINKALKSFKELALKFAKTKGKKLCTVLALSPWRLASEAMFKTFATFNTSVIEEDEVNVCAPSHALN